MVSIISGTTKKPISSKQLCDFFNQHEEYEGTLYIGYPIIGTVNGPYPIDALWVSEQKGIVIFNLIEGVNTEHYESLQDESYNKMDAKLRIYNQLLKGRKLCVEISIITFWSAKRIDELNSDYPLCNEENLSEVIEGISWDDKSYYKSLLSVLQSISNIRTSKKKRNIKKEDSRGAKLRRIEDSIANLDNHQSHAVIETVDGVQRIRGLAGSGKTIVLALKAAYLHAQNPDWKIAITFNTRSLKGQFRRLINNFYIAQANKEPDWDNLQIIHAWGAPGGGEKDGLYYSYCALHDVEYYDFRTAKNKYGLADPFGDACEAAIQEAKNSEKGIYDVVLIDEAQDFSPSFLRLCYSLLKKPKRLVYAYDELQNLGKESLPAPELIFGKNNDGTPKVSFENGNNNYKEQDIILEKCYRNSRPALVTAHALGFGIYRKNNPEIGTGIVQMFEENTLWNDIGYDVESGELSDGKQVCLKRTPNTSPKFLENHSDIDDLVMFKPFPTIEEQNEWVANQIKDNLNKDELRYDDIIVINPNPLTTRKLVPAIRSILFQKGISSHIAGVDTTPDVFFDDESESIVFTGIYRAKGNEAAMVYIVNAQDCYQSDDMAHSRNTLFTAITRSKAWVRVVGVGSQMDALISEYQNVKENDYKLKFVYPTAEQRKYINIVNRDKSLADKQNVRKNKSAINSLIRDLEEGKIYKEDLDPDDLQRLRDFLL